MASSFSHPSSSRRVGRDGFVHPSIIVDDPSYQPRKEAYSATLTMQEAMRNGQTSPLTTPIASNRNAASTSAARRSSSRSRQQQQQHGKEHDNRRHHTATTTSPATLLQAPKTCPACASRLVYHKVSHRHRHHHAEEVHPADSATTAGTNTEGGGDWSFDEIHPSDPMTHFDSGASYTANAPPPLSNECSVLLPLETLLDAVIETYCESILERNHEENATNLDTSRRQQHQQQQLHQQQRRRRSLQGSIQPQPDEAAEPNVADRSKGAVAWQKDESLKMVPPYCPSCKTYIVLESFWNTYYQDELLSNLASWLAQSFSQDSDTSDHHKSSSSIRPANGSILVVLDTKTATTSRHTNAPLSPSTTTVSTDEKRRTAIDFFSKLKEQALLAAASSSPRHNISPSRWNEDREENTSTASVNNSNRLRGSISPLLSGYGSLSRDSTTNKWSDLILQGLKPTQPNIHVTAQHDNSERFISRHDDGESPEPRVGRGATSWEDRVVVKGSDNSGHSSQERRDDEDDGTLVYSVSNEDSKTTAKRRPILDQAAKTKILSPRRVELDLQQVSTLDEERLIVGDYALTRGIATRAIGKKLTEGFLLTSIQCKDCHMPLMARDGNAGCVVCPIVTRKAKKRARQLREAIQMAWAPSPRSDCSNLPEFEVLETVPSALSTPTKLDPNASPHRNVFGYSDNQSPINANHQSTTGEGRAPSKGATSDDVNRSPSSIHENIGSPTRPARNESGNQGNQPTHDNNSVQSGSKIRLNPPGTSPRHIESPQRGPTLINLSPLSPTKQLIEVNGSHVYEGGSAGIPLPPLHESGRQSAVASPLTTMSSLPSLTNSSLTTYRDHSETSTRHQIRKAATSEVYRRLQNGWQMTSSQCSTCRAPLMQSPADEIDCVFCETTDALSPKSVTSQRSQGEAEPQKTTESPSIAMESHRSSSKSPKRLISLQNPSPFVGNPMSPTQSNPSNSRDASPQKRPPTSPSKNATAATADSASTPRSHSSSRRSRSSQEAETKSLDAVETQIVPMHVVTSQKKDRESIQNAASLSPITQQISLTRQDSASRLSSGSATVQKSLHDENENLEDKAHGAGFGSKGMRYLAIPEGLDINDEQAMLSLLFELRKNTIAESAKNAKTTPDLKPHETNTSISDEDNRKSEVLKWSEVVALSLLESQNDSPPFQGDVDMLSAEAEGLSSRSEEVRFIASDGIPQSHTREVSSYHDMHQGSQDFRRGAAFQLTEPWHEVGYDETDPLLKGHSLSRNREFLRPAHSAAGKVNEDEMPPMMPDLSCRPSGTMSVRTGYSDQDSAFDIVEEFARELQSLALDDQSIVDDIGNERQEDEDTCPFCWQKLDGGRENSFCGNRKCKFFMVPRDVMGFFSASSENDDDARTAQYSYGSSTSRQSANVFLPSQLQVEAASFSGSTFSLPSSQLKLRFAEASEYGSPQSSQRLLLHESPHHGSRDLAIRSLASTISPDPSDPLSPSRVSYRSAQRINSSSFVGAAWNESVLNVRGPVVNPGMTDRARSQQSVHELVDRLAIAAKALKDLESSVSRAENSSTASSSVISSAPSSVRSFKLNL